MHVWNVLRVAWWKYRTQKLRQKSESPSVHHRTNLSGYIFAIKHVSTIRKKIVKQQYLLHMSPQYGKRRPTNGWDPFGSLGHPSKFHRVSYLGCVNARHSSILSRSRALIASYITWRSIRQYSVKAKFHYAIWSQTSSKLVADLQRAGIWPII